MFKSFPDKWLQDLPQDTLRLIGRNGLRLGLEMVSVKADWYDN
jgi:hypothetical protein